MSEQLLRVEEAAEVLACSRETVYRLVREGDLAFVRVRGSMKFKKADLDRYIESQYQPARRR